MAGDEERVAIATAKRVLRSAVRFRRDARSPKQRQADDEQRFGRYVDLLAVTGPRRTALYLSAGAEPDTLRSIAWSVASGVEVWLPVLTDGRGGLRSAPAWAPYAGPDRLREGRSGILEPTTPVLPGDPLSALDLIIVPGLAADRSGRRLGRGGGWYDRARAAHRNLPAWLLLNDDEVLDVVPTDSWDLPVDVIITPTRTLRLEGGA